MEGDVLRTSWEPTFAGWIVTSPKEPDRLTKSSYSDSNDSDIEVPVVRGRGSYGLRPKLARIQVSKDIYVHGVFVIYILLGNIYIYIFIYKYIYIYIIYIYIYKYIYTYVKYIYYIYIKLIIYIYCIKY